MNFFITSGLCTSVQIICNILSNPKIIKPRLWCFLVFPWEDAIPCLGDSFIWQEAAHFLLLLEAKQELSFSTVDQQVEVNVNKREQYQKFLWSLLSHSLDNCGNWELLGSPVGTVPAVIFPSFSYFHCCLREKVGEFCFRYRITGRVEN